MACLTKGLCLIQPAHQLTSGSSEHESESYQDVEWIECQLVDLAELQEMNSDRSKVALPAESTSLSMW